jgi:predicted nucleic-acid-binding protein
MLAVDTNILVRLIARDDALQTELAERFVEKGGWVSLVTLADAIWILRRNYKRNAAGVAEAVEKLLNHKNLVLQDSDVVAAALALFRSRPSLGFADCLMLEIARKAGHLPLGTFDRALGRVDGTHLL